ncbi:MAG: phosphocholine cytidylyltransferase family protein [Rhodospirillaceae bacterium]
MQALMLAAGVARRLYGGEGDTLPKALLQFDGKTLLQRHIEVLTRLGVSGLTVVVGHQRDIIEAELARVAPKGFAKTVFNPLYRETPIISLATGRDTMRSGEPVLFMDADVLYHDDLMECLIARAGDTCILMDRDFEPGAEPVKVCVRDGVLVDFGKKITETHDTVGEWPGFMLMSPDIAGRIAERADQMVAHDPPDYTYEEAMCFVLKASPPGTFGYEDITGIPWIEIDFPEDLERATNEIIRKITAYNPAGD